MNRFDRYIFQCRQLINEIKKNLAYPKKCKHLIEKCIDALNLAWKESEMILGAEASEYAEIELRWIEADLKRLDYKRFLNVDDNEDDDEYTDEEYNDEDNFESSGEDDFENDSEDW